MKRVSAVVKDRSTRHARFPYTLAFAVPALFAAAASAAFAQLILAGVASRTLLYVLGTGYVALLAVMGITWLVLLRPALRRVERSRSRLRALYRQNPDAIATFDLQGRIVSSNPAAMQLVGLPEGGDTSAHFARYLPHDVIGEATAAFRRSAAGEATQLEIPLLHASGRRVPVLCNLYPHLVDGRIVGVYGIARDVTALVRARAALSESEQRFRSLFEQHSDAVQSFDLQGRYVSVNDATERITGFSDRELAGRQLGSLQGNTATSVSKHAVRRLRRGETIEYETSVVRRDGVRIELQGKAIPIVYDGAVHGFYAISRDVTQERRAQRDVVEQSQRIRDLYLVAASGQTSQQQIVNALALGTQRLNMTWGFLTRIDEGLATLEASVGQKPFGIQSSAPVGRTMLRHAIAAGDIFVVDDMRDERWRADPSGRSEQYESYVAVPIALGGTTYGVAGFAAQRARDVPLSQADRDFIRLIGALLGVAIERREQQQQLDSLAFFDSLTGLPNRVLLEDRIVQTIETARRKSTVFAIVFLDLDGFKAVNDAGGHSAGDAVLRTVAKRLRGAVRASDTVARMGGDEFVVVLPEVRDAAGAADVAAKLIADVSEPYEAGGERRVLGASAGIALYPHDGGDAEALLINADRALYRAKTRGRGRFEIYRHLHGVQAPPAPP